MIQGIFPIPIYVGNNTDLLPLARETFKLAEPHLEEVGKGFRTTLKEYCPLKAVTPWNPLIEPDCQPIVSFIKESVHAYLFESGFDLYDVTVTNMWYNTMESRGQHNPHTHYGYTFSGTYYIDTPGASNKVAFHSVIGDFYQSMKHVREHTAFTSHTSWLTVKEGDIVIFPAYAKHSVPEFEFEGTRRCIPFDIVCQPIYVNKFGNADATEV